MGKKISIFRMGFVVLALAVLLLSVSVVSAFGISSKYWEGRALDIYPGETKIVELDLQNSVGDNDITVRATQVKGFEIASMEDKDYFLPAHTKGIMVPITISVPLDEAIGGEYKVSVLFKSAPPTSGGTISIGTGSVTTFDVLVITKPLLAPEDEGRNTLLIVGIAVLVLIIALVIWMIIRRKKKNAEMPTAMSSMKPNKPVVKSVKKKI